MGSPRAGGKHAGATLTTTVEAMRINRCGTSGLEVSDLGLGTLTWGRDTDAHEAEDMLTAFVSAGGSLVEISPTHGDGLATDVLGALVPVVGRHRLVLAWRGGARLGADGRLAASAARGVMLSGLDDALQRLGTDHVDLWLAGPDPVVPLDETLSALEIAWHTGRAHYVGLSHRGVWDTAWARSRAEMPGGPPLTAVEEEFSLLARDDEGGLLRPVIRSGMGVLAHSPLAGGVLTGKYRHSTPADSRAASPHLRHLVEPHMGPDARGVVEAVVRAAQGLERTPLDVALTWVRGATGISSAVVGPRSARQMAQILDGGEPLPAQIRQVLDEVSRPPRR